MAETCSLAPPHASSAQSSTERLKQTLHMPVRPRLHVQIRPARRGWDHEGASNSATRFARSPYAKEELAVAGEAEPVALRSADRVSAFVGHDLLRAY